MAKIVVGWQLTRPLQDAEIQRFIARVKGRYQELFEDVLDHRGLWLDNQGLLGFDIQAAADPGLFVSENRILCMTGQPSVTDHAKESGAVKLDAASLDRLLSAERSTHRINPPFTLCSFDKARKSLRVFHDGLGMDSFFVAQAGGAVVFSNKCWCILELLGETPKIDFAAWRYWFCMGWFPENSTPFQNIRYLDQGESIAMDSRSIAIHKDCALPAWIAGGSENPLELMERAEDSVRKLILENRSPNGRYYADLTGGIDSRAVCSVLLKEGVPCSFSTGGARCSPDVIIAGQLAKQFHLTWEPRQDAPGPHSGNKPDDRQRWDQQFRKMTLWAEGMVEPNGFASYQQGRAARQEHPRLGGGSAEISKGQFYAQALLSKPARSYSECEMRLLDYLGRLADSVLTGADSAALQDRLRAQIAGGRAYGLRDFGLLDCFYIAHRTRRWQSAHLAANLFDVAVLPFVNIEHIRLGFAMNPDGKAAKSFQMFLIRRNAERLLSVPFNQMPASGVLRKLAARVSGMLGRSTNIGTSDHFHSKGSDYIQRVTMLQTPLETILDFGKRKDRQGWARLGVEDWYFYLRLISFCYWHDHYISQSALTGTVVWL